jgi:hypothetical protein
MTLYTLPLHSNNNRILLNHTAGNRHGKTSLEHILEKTAACHPQKLIHLAQNREKISPWGLYCIYRAAVIYMQLNRETGDMSAVGNQTVYKQVLGIMRTRWNAAGTLLTPCKSNLN